MNPDDRPVEVRTSASAKDFWCRTLWDDPENVSPHDFKAKKKHPSVSAVSAVSAVAGAVVAVVDRVDRVDRDTPYGMQHGPFSISRLHEEGVPPRPPLGAVPTGLTNSRIVERQVYQRTLAELESDMKKLKRRNAALEKRFASALKVNKALAAQMSEMCMERADD